MKILAENNKGAAMVEEILSAGTRATTLTRQLLLFSRRQDLQLRPVHLNEIIGNMAKTLGRMLGEHIALEFQYDPALPLTNADANALEQVLINLATAAYPYAIGYLKPPRRPEITESVSRSHGKRP